MKYKVDNNISREALEAHLNARMSEGYSICQIIWVLNDNSDFIEDIPDWSGFFTVISTIPSASVKVA